MTPAVSGPGSACAVVTCTPLKKSLISIGVGWGLVCGCGGVSNGMTAATSWRVLGSRCIKDAMQEKHIMGWKVGRHPSVWQSNPVAECGRKRSGAKSNVFTL